MNNESLPRGWTEQIDPATGAHIYINEVTTQQTLAKPPNEVLPDGWTHVYYEEHQRFAYMKVGTNIVVADITDIPGYVPPQVSPVQSQPELQQLQRQSVQSDLPKGWIEQIDPNTGAHIYINEITGQQTPVRPPNEFVPDGWTHIYYEEHQKFAYMELATKKVVVNITDIKPDDIPHQGDLPKGWDEHIDPTTGEHWFINGVTTQQTTVRPPNEVLPDGWTHVYYEEYQKFAIMKVGTAIVVASVNEIPGYVPPPQNDSETGEEKGDQLSQQMMNLNLSKDKSVEDDEPSDKNDNLVTSSVNTSKDQQDVSPQQPQPEPQQQPVQNDLPKGWSEQIDPATGAHVYINEVTHQQTTVKPPNEVLPDGWYHYYVEQYQNYGYVQPETKKTFWIITDIPGYVPPQQVQEPQIDAATEDKKDAQDKGEPENKTIKPIINISDSGDNNDDDDDDDIVIIPSNNNGLLNVLSQSKPSGDILTNLSDVHNEEKGHAEEKNEEKQSNSLQPEPQQLDKSDSKPEPQQEPQQQPENSLPKGWIESDQNGVKWYGNETTRQWTQVRPPNEVLPDGWFHYYIEQLKKFGYYNPSTRATAMSITEIPGYVPPQVSPVQSQPEPQQEQKQHEDQSQESKQSEPEEEDQKQDEPQKPQQPEDNLPKGWTETFQNGIRWYGNEQTKQWIQERPPNEVLPDGWYHYYIKPYQKFGYYNPSTRATAMSITEIPGYVPPQQVQPQEPHNDAETEDKKDAQIGGVPENNDDAKGNDNNDNDNDDGKVPDVPPQISPVPSQPEPQQPQSQQQPPSPPRQEPQQPVQSDLPKGWTEQIDPATGAHVYINGVTTRTARCTSG